MSISDLQEQIMRDERRIDFLEEEKRRIGREISTMLDEDEDFRRYSAKFSDNLEIEQAQVGKIEGNSNLPKIAVACGEDMRDLLTGGKAVSAMSSIDCIKRAFEDTIDEKEEELKMTRREINRLEEDIWDCKHEIAILREEEQRFERGM